MSSLKHSSPTQDDDVIRAIAIRICVFANGHCDCRDRERVCERTEIEAARVAKVALDAIATSLRGPK